jgi:hypothetical protein
MLRFRRLLVIQTPGGLYEHFFEEVDKPVDDEEGPLGFEQQPGVGRIVKVATEYGIEIAVPIAKLVDERELHRLRVGPHHSYSPIE